MRVHLRAGLNEPRRVRPEPALSWSKGGIEDFLM